MGIAWDRLNDAEKAKWKELIDEDHLYDFEQAILGLEETNRQMKRVGTFFRILSLGGNVADRAQAKQRVEGYLKKFRDFERWLQSQDRFQTESGTPEEISWSRYPKYRKVKPLRDQARRAVARA